MFKKYQHIHFVGIGGVGMSGIAEVLLNARLSGHRLRRPARRGGGAARAAGRQGLRWATQPPTWRARTSSSTPRRWPRDNVEVRGARQRGVPVIARAEMLAELMRLKYGIAIAGTHGKTTTTSMVAAVLGAGGLDPTVVVGGRVHGLGTNARLGPGRVPGRGGRRVRRLLPQAHSDHRGGDHRRRRAPRPLPGPRRDRGRVPRVREQGAVLRRGRASAWTTPTCSE